MIYSFLLKTHCFCSVVAIVKIFDVYSILSSWLLIVSAVWWLIVVLVGGFAFVVALVLI